MKIDQQTQKAVASKVQTKAAVKAKDIGDDYGDAD